MKKLLLSLFITLAAATLWAKQAEFKREINKNFAVSANASLSITNKYGNVNIIESDEGKIVFTIEITGKGKTAEIAKQYAEIISVDFKTANNNVSAKTNIPGMKCSNCGISVNYVVMVPRSVTMNFDLRYGNLTLNDTPKPLKVSIKYGTLNANEISDATIDTQYGNVKINKCSELLLKSSYSNSDFNSIGNANINAKYGNFKIDKCKDITINTQYSNIHIKNLENSIISDNTYGDLKIDNISTNFSKIAANGKFTNFFLGLNDKHNFKTELSTSFGKINLSKIKISIDKQIKETTKQEIMGVAGTLSNPKAEVKVSTSYGNINFNQK